MFDHLEQKKLKVVVIGAGMAGLAAARQLKSLGAEVIVIEARVSLDCIRLLQDLYCLLS